MIPKYIMLTSRMYSKLDEQKNSAEVGHMIQYRIRSTEIPS